MDHGISYWDLFGANPIPTYDLDSMSESWVKLDAEKALVFVNAFNTKSPEGIVIDLKKERKRLLNIINSETAEDRTDARVNAFKKLLSGAGKTMTAETERELRG